MAPLSCDLCRPAAGAADGRGAGGAAGPVRGARCGADPPGDGPGRLRLARGRSVPVFARSQSFPACHTRRNHSPPATPVAIIPRLPHPSQLFPACHTRRFCAKSLFRLPHPIPVVYGEPAKGELVALAGSVCVRVRAFVDYASCRADLRSWRLAGAALRAVGDGAVPPRRGLGRQRAGAGAGARD